uniref:Uncharacterized protein n=1 Tax=viral metagenome TaxID=1070528 RepID=A0A6C0CPX1_9ZZZZ
MENFLYNINEIRKKRTHSIDEVMDYYNNINIPTPETSDYEYNEDNDEYFIDLDEESLRKEYKSYRVCELRDIMKYYSIPSKKMRKTELIRKIVAFELNQENAALVQLRYTDN